MAKRKSDLKTVKKAISLREDIYNDAEELADEMFGGNFSAFISFAVVSFKKGLVTVVDSTHPNSYKVVEQVPEEEDIAEKSPDKVNFIDSIMNSMKKDQ